MKDNSLLFSLMVSTLVTFCIYIYNKYHIKEKDTKKITNESITLFIITFIISFICKYYMLSTDTISTNSNIVIKPSTQCPF